MRKKSFAAGLVVLSCLVACGGESGGGGGGGGGGPGGGAGGGLPGGSGGGGAASGSFPAELVGIWQNTLASGGTVTNTLTGVEFSMTQGYSAQLKVRANGEFYFAHFSAGVASNCASVSFFDQMVGLAEFRDNQLTLRPRERRLDVSNCANSGSFAQALDPVTFDAALSEYETSLDTTLQMELSGGPYPLSFKLLNRAPPATPPASSQPAGFQVGDVIAYQDVIKRWGRYEVDFYDPQTGTYRFPDCCGENRFLRFSPSGYELGFAFINANLEGVCKRDLIYFERGESRFIVTEQRGTDTSQGDLRLQASEARLIVRIRECGDEDGVTEYPVPPQVGYYRFSYTTPAGGESLMLGCQYPRGHSARFAVCYDANPWVTVTPK